jgi:hypothetical protein
LCPAYECPDEQTSDEASYRLVLAEDRFPIDEFLAEIYRLAAAEKQWGSIGAIRGKDIVESFEHLDSRRHPIINFSLLIWNTR